MTDPLLRVQDLTISFGDREVLEAISLEAQPGELLALVGPSGCGKSTLLNAVSRLLGPEATISGRIALRDGARLGYVFQRDALLPWYTTLRNVEIGAQLRGVSGAERKAEAQRLLKLVHLEGADDQYPAQLSGGMRQRASLARVLAYAPDLILLDEPFVALDAFTRMALQNQLLEIWRTTGKTMVIVTHDPDEALLLGQRIVVLDRNPGRIHSQFQVDWPAERTIEQLRSSDAFLERSRELWELLLRVGAGGSAEASLRPADDRVNAEVA
ncbi:MAG: ABC transporter ATP-binding protein [Solirubrobacterales bacterium]|nr:ABC transporter ATP-binding protein [Solirubrobacterales bacterium]